MSRPPSMTVAEAAALLGNPASFKIDNENRNVVRKWATATGYAARDVYALKNDQLETLYRTGSWPATDQEPVTMPDVTPATPAPAVATPAPAAAASVAANATDDLAAALRRVIGPSPVDENKVREIAGSMIADAIANIELPTVATRLEVTTPTGTHVVEGTVHEMTSTVISIAALNHDIMLIGPAGSGKTTIGQNVATALGFDFYITSTVLDTHELIGFVDGYGKYHSTAFRMAFEHGGVWVADEIDAWDAAALLAANSALANGVCTFPDSDKPVARHPNFRVIGTANTFGHGADRVYVGRNELDAATLDRFATIDMDYDTKLEAALSINADWLNRVQSVRQSVRSHSIRHVVSTRAIIKGQEALAVGLPLKTVEDIYLFKGMSESDRKMVG